MQNETRVVFTLAWVAGYDVVRIHGEAFHPEGEWGFCVKEYVPLGRIASGVQDALAELERLAPGPFDD